ncbi:MAG: 50S ribosomal protein L10 [Bdellovibrionales bacterium]
MNAQRQKKADTIANLQNDVLGNAGIVIITVNKGLNAADAVDLRNKVRSAGASYKVAKNTLVKRALTGSTFAGIDKYLTGPTALTTSPDAVSAAKVIAEFAKANDKLEIIGAGFGDQVLDANGVKNLAKLPSLNELRGKIVGLLQAPATKIAGVLQAPAGQLARVMAAKAKQAA